MNFGLLISYLKKLNKHNTREWFENNKPEFESLRLGFLEYIQSVMIDLEKKDPQIGGIEAKKALFRMNRDVRFSKDKSPYKNNFGASIKPDGKKSPFAGYYIHIEPGKSFLGGGLYLPDSFVLDKVRSGIDFDPDSLRHIIAEKKFKTYFKKIQGDQLKNPPKGFDAEHPALNFLKFKSFLMMHPLRDEEVCHANFSEQTKKILGAMVPFNQYLNKAISYIE